jgi:hypothetical protein
LFETEDVALIEIGMGSKWCEAFSLSGNTVLINATDKSRNLNEYVYRDLSTEICLPKYTHENGWHIFNFSTTRDRLRICFYRPS